MKCEECGWNDAEFLCVECDESLCSDCDVAIHRGGKRKSHLRPSICKNCRKKADIKCMSCVMYLCNDCETAHASHKISAISALKRIGVFWDLGSCRPARNEEFMQIVSEIEQRFGKPEFIKSYGDPWGK